MPAPLQYPERLQVRFAAGTLLRMATLRRKGEPYAALVRRAVERELNRLAKQRKQK